MYIRVGRRLWEQNKVASPRCNSDETTENWQDRQLVRCVHANAKPISYSYVSSSRFAFPRVLLQAYKWRILRHWCSTTTTTTITTTEKRHQSFIFIILKTKLQPKFQWILSVWRLYFSWNLICMIIHNCIR